MIVSRMGPSWPCDEILGEMIKLLWKTSFSSSLGIAELGGWEHTNLKVSAAILTPHEENLPRYIVNKEKKKPETEKSSQ